MHVDNGSGELADLSDHFVPLLSPFVVRSPRRSRVAPPAVEQVTCHCLRLRDHTIRRQKRHGEFPARGNFSAGQVGKQRPFFSERCLLSYENGSCDEPC